MKKTCIILFSHADSIEKESILEKTLLSLKMLNLPIILVSHAPVSLENQKKCDHVIYEKNNLLLKETDFFNENLPLTEANFNTQFFFGGISTRCYLHKKTYGPAVTNLYINGFSLANTLGYDFGLLWEYDYLLDEFTSNNVKNIIFDICKNNNDGFFIPCKISGVPSITAVPAILPIKKFVEFLPKKIIESSKEYIESTNLMICEEWIYSFVKSLSNPKLLAFEDYYTMFTEFNNNLVSSGVDNPLFGGLNSGLFIDKNDRKNWILSVYNSSKSIISINIDASLDNETPINLSGVFYPEMWKYVVIPQHISEKVLEHGSILNVIETVSINDVDEIYEYVVSSSNIDSISKGKLFFYI